MQNDGRRKDTYTKHAAADSSARVGERGVDACPTGDRIAIRAALLGDLLRKHSSSASLVVVTLPLPAPPNTPSGAPQGGKYLAAMEALSFGLPPTLMMRGNNQNVVTFSS